MQYLPQGYGGRGFSREIISCRNRTPILSLPPWFTRRAGWGLAVLVVFAFLLMRVFWIISRARGLFPTLVAFGIGTMLLFNIAWNLGMQVGLLPVAGINLPFFSYGGSAMLMNFIAMGLLLNIAKEIQPVPLA